jgi:hypothetical protein
VCTQRMVTLAILCIQCCSHRSINVFVTVMYITTARVEAKKLDLVARD